jgi:hypothetical protein
MAGLFAYLMSILAVLASHGTPRNGWFWRGLKVEDEIRESSRFGLELELELGTAESESGVGSVVHNSGLEDRSPGSGKQAG